MSEPADDAVQPASDVSDASDATDEAAHVPREALRRLGVLRMDSQLLTLTALLYLAAAGATTWITWRLGYEDWFLYALMSLCTATAITNYSVLRPGAPWWLRIIVWGFAEAVIAGWTLLLYEKTQVGWVLVAGEAVDQGVQGLFFVPVAINLVCALLLAGHLLFIAPRVRKQAATG